jgi:hypothetical protein
MRGHRERSGLLFSPHVHKMLNRHWISHHDLWQRGHLRRRTAHKGYQWTLTLWTYGPSRVEAPSPSRCHVSAADQIFRKRGLLR